MKQIPEQLKKNQELIDKAMIDYELIEEFNYNISAEDFNAKWVDEDYLSNNEWELNIVCSLPGCSRHDRSCPTLPATQNSILSDEDFWASGITGVILDMVSLFLWLPPLPLEQWW